jgi:hypothetical protein
MTNKIETYVILVPLPFDFTEFLVERSSFTAMFQRKLGKIYAEKTKKRNK